MRNLPAGRQVRNKELERRRHKILSEK